MNSPSSSSSGRPSSREGRPVTAPDLSGLSEEEIMAARFIGATVEGDIPRFNELAERLRGAKKSLEEVVATVVMKLEGYGRGLLHLAAYFGKLDMCKILVDDVGLDVDAADVDGAAPLRFAVNSRSEAVVELLLDRGADANKADRTGFTALHSAAALASLCPCICSF